MAKRSAQQLRRTAAQMHALAAVRDDIGSQDSLTGREDISGNSPSIFANTILFSRLNNCISASQSASTILIGDYHALPACQRFAAELLETSARDRRVALGRRSNTGQRPKNS